MASDEKRLFFGWEVEAPWPEKLPFGRLLDEGHRHLTVAFLGKTHYPSLKEALVTFPLPSFSVARVGYFDKCLLLPEKHPHVVAWHIAWFDRENPLLFYYDNVVAWLKEKGFTPNLRHGFMPHVTLARAPFRAKSWLRQFFPLPVMIKGFHLYESAGNLKYIPLWSLPILPPFEEIEHTADRAFLVRGADFTQLYHNGATALAFAFPPLLPFIHVGDPLESLENVVMELNHIIRKADQEIGSPFKAVSYHSHLTQKPECLQWEMIVDV